MNPASRFIHNREVKLTVLATADLHTNIPAVYLNTFKSINGLT